jgi:hypothetical protein
LRPPRSYSLEVGARHASGRSGFTTSKPRGSGAVSGRSRTRTWDLFLISVRRARDVGAVAGMVVTKYLLIGGCGKTVVTLTARRGSADVPVSYRRATTAWW